MRTEHTEPERNHWLWVTRPGYYAEEDGTDRADLDPESGVDSDGWWTCHRDTRRGDLVLLWRTSPRCDIGYLIQARSKAYTLNAEAKDQRNWTFGCDYVVLCKLRNPITLATLRSVPHLEDWGALRGNFQRSSFLIPPTHWERLVRLIVEENPKASSAIRLAEVQDAPRRVLLEEQIEDQLAKDLSVLRKYGYDLELRERQRVCQGNGGRIDLLCYDKSARYYVVIELKNVRASRSTCAQIQSYLGWVTKNLPKRNKPIGIVISRGADPGFLDAAELVPSIRLVDLTDIGFE